MELFRQLGAVQREFTALSNRASARYGAGRLEQALDDLSRALPAHRDAGKKLPLGDALYISSLVHLELGELEEGMRLATEAVDLALELRDHTLEGYWLLALGHAQRALGAYAEALTSYHRSATLHRRLGDQNREALAWQGTGDTYLLMQRPGDAADFQSRATAAHSALGDTWSQAIGLDAWAAALGGGDAEGARSKRQQALQLVAAFSDGRAVRLREKLEEQLRQPGI